MGNLLEKKNLSISTFSRLLKEIVFPYFSIYMNHLPLLEGFQKGFWTMIGTALFLSLFGSFHLSFCHFTWGLQAICWQCLWTNFSASFHIYFLNYFTQALHTLVLLLTCIYVFQMMLFLFTQYLTINLNTLQMSQINI